MSLRPQASAARQPDEYMNSSTARWRAPLGFVVSQPESMACTASTVGIRGSDGGSLRTCNGSASVWLMWPRSASQPSKARTAANRRATVLDLRPEVRSSSSQPVTASPVTCSGAVIGGSRLAIASEKIWRSDL